MGTKDIQLYFVLLLTSLMILTSSCDRYRQPDQADRLDQIQQKIDQGQHDEAISELQSILNQEPENDRARTILASAFVHRAGISLTDYFKLAEIFLAPDLPHSEKLIKTSFLKQIEEVKSKEAKQLLNFAERLNQVYSQALQIEMRFNQVPNLDSKQAVQFYLALQELAKLKKPTAGMKLYRGTLKIYYFKHLWSTNAWFPKKGNQLCRMKVNDLVQRVSSFGLFSLGMISDLSNASLEVAKEFASESEGLKTDLNKVQSFLNQTNSKNMDLESFLRNRLKTELKEANLGDLKCNF